MNRPNRIKTCLLICTFQCGSNTKLILTFICHFILYIPCTWVNWPFQSFFHRHLTKGRWVRPFFNFISYSEAEIPNPGRVHVYKAQSSHRVVKAEPGNTIPGSKINYSSINRLSNQHLRDNSSINRQLAKFSEQ